MREVIEEMALVCTTAGLIAGLLVLVRTRAVVGAVQVALEFWTAAGLLRLSSSGTWSAVGTAAAVVALRQLIGFGLRRSAGPLGRPAHLALALRRQRPGSRDRGAVEGS